MPCAADDRLINIGSRCVDARRTLASDRRSRPNSREAARCSCQEVLLMDEVINGSDTKDEIKVERPRLHKVILVNDDYTPREFVVTVLKAEFRLSEDQALRVMITAHRRGGGTSRSTQRM